MTKLNSIPNGHLSLCEYQRQAMRTAGDHVQPTVYGALAVAGEAGELADAIKKKVFHCADITSAELAREVGDVLWGLAYLAYYLGYDLEQIARINLEKLQKRYPQGFVEGGGNR